MLTVTDEVLRGQNVCITIHLNCYVIAQQVPRPYQKQCIRKRLRMIKCDLHLLEGRHLVTQDGVSLEDMEIVPPTLSVHDFKSDVDVCLRPDETERGG